MTYFCFCSGTVLVQTRHHDSGCPYFSVSPPPLARLRPSNYKAIALLPIAITTLSHESGREHNRLMHLSSSEILISTDDNWLTIVLNAFRCSVTEFPSFILRLYSFFCRNSLFTRDLDWYKVPNLFHKSFVVASLDTFRNSESKTHNCIVLFSF